MLVKLAFAMQRLKKYLCHDQQRWGGDRCYEGGLRDHWESPSPPLGKTLIPCGKALNSFFKLKAVDK